MAVFRVVQRFHGHCNGNARIKAFLLTLIRMRFFSESKVFSNGDDTVLPVLIVGAEPAGLVLSILLTKLGVKCAVLEKTNNFLRHPHAHYINNRSMKFVDEKVQWMHIDLVGPVRNEKKRIATGFGISILVEWVAKHSG